MPYISLKTNVKLSAEQEISIKEKLGKAIAIIPGKSESWLMISVEDNCHMWFKGKNDSPIAFVEIKSFGAIPSSASEKLTPEICSIMETAGIASACTYVRYEETSVWGWNGSNF